MDALIIAATEKQQHAIAEVVNRLCGFDVVVCDSAMTARRLALARRFDLFVINSGLKDEHGKELAVDLMQKDEGGVVIIEDFAHVERLQDALADDGVIVIGRPLLKSVLYQAVKTVHATNMRVARLRKRNAELETKFEDLKYVNRAKIILMESLGYTESQAHKYMEKRAMDTRQSKRAVALDILKTYEN